MSWLSKAAKKVEKAVSKTATKAGVGSDLKKAANIFGAANVGGVVGVVTGFLTGGAPGAVYGGVTGGITAGIAKSKGQSSSKYLSNAAGNAAIAGAVGPLIYKPAGTALITAPGPVSGYGNAAGQITVRTSSGSLIGNIASGASNVIKDAVNYIGKGGVTALASDAIKNIFSKKTPPGDLNPDYQQGNAVPPGGSFEKWLATILPGKSYDPTAAGSSGTAGGGESSPVIEVGGSSLMGSDFSALGKPLLGAALILGAGYFLIKKKAF
jgi:hypothetical protein